MHIPTCSLQTCLPTVYSCGVKLTVGCSHVARSYYTIQTRLDALGARAASPLLRSQELDGGSSFEIVLTVSNFLKSTSMTVTFSMARAALPIPTITIQAPPILLFSTLTTVSIDASATLPSCVNASTISFAWTLSSSASLKTGAAMTKSLVLDATSRTRRDLYVA